VTRAERLRLETLRLGSLIWRVRADALEPALRDLLADPDRHLPDPNGSPAGARSTTEVALVGGFFLKRFNAARPGKLLKELFRGTPAQRAFDLALEMERAGIATPRALAVAHRRWGRIPWPRYLLTERIAQPTPLDRWDRDSVRASRSVAQFVARLHDHGFFHGDLNLENLVVTPDAELSRVDLDTMRRVRRLTGAQAAWELARFWRRALAWPGASRSARAHLLKEYCARRGLPDWRAWWKRIEEINRARDARLARKRRGSRGPG
jgi:tRNA A-37 threonylcarbamoyl transferase component Bud32